MHRIANLRIVALANWHSAGLNWSWQQWQRWIDEARAAIGPAGLVTATERSDGRFDLLAYDTEAGCEWRYSGAPAAVLGNCRFPSEAR